VEEDPDLGHWNVHTVSNLLVRQTFQAAEPEHFRLLVGQKRHSLSHALHDFCCLCLLNRTGRFGSRFRDAIDWDESIPGSIPLSQTVHCSAGGQAGQNGAPVDNRLALGQPPRGQESFLVAVLSIGLMI
jgi:hypothetical protein